MTLSGIVTWTLTPSGPTLIWRTVWSIITGPNIRLEGMIDESPTSTTFAIWAEGTTGLSFGRNPWKQSKR
jgi:hypothetical protein